MVKSNLTQKTAVFQDKSKDSYLRKSNQIQGYLDLGLLLSEKCELLKAKEQYLVALEEAKKVGEWSYMMDALAQLLRLAGEARDTKEVSKLEAQLDALIELAPNEVPYQVWYCKAWIYYHYLDLRNARKYLLKTLRALRKAENKLTKDEVALGLFRTWYHVARVFAYQKRYTYSRSIAEAMLKRIRGERYSALRGTYYLLLSSITLKVEKDADQAEEWLERAQEAVLAGHNWYFHLYVLLGYAQLSRFKNDFIKAYFYLNLVEKTARGPEFDLIRFEVAREKERLESNQVDLIVDSRKGFVKTRESEAIAIRKQFVLLEILTSLAQKHREEGAELGSGSEQGLSKAEIIEKVWGERYRPEAHDNKLYYNINRLRKLIEPNAKEPKYLLNWREGYRLAPGLKIQLVGSGTVLKTLVSEKEGNS